MVISYGNVLLNVQGDIYGNISISIVLIFHEMILMDSLFLSNTTNYLVML